MRECTTGLVANKQMVKYRCINGALGYLPPSIVSSLRIVTYCQGFVLHVRRPVVQGERFAPFILLP